MSASNTKKNEIAFLRSLEDLKTVSTIPNKGKRVPARLCHVIDGDTIEFVVIFAGQPLRVTIRVLNIDTPEKTLKEGVTVREKQAGLMIKEYVTKLFESEKIYYVKLVDHDVYRGRYLGEVYLDKELTLSDHLLKMKLCRAYSGGRKDKWEKSCLDDMCTALEELGIECPAVERKERKPRPKKEVKKTEQVMYVKVAKKSD